MGYWQKTTKKYEENFFINDDFPPIIDFIYNSHDVYSGNHYDEKGNRIEETAYDTMARRISRAKLIEETSYDKDGSRINITTHKYQYDERGNLTKKWSFGDNRGNALIELHEWIYEYY